MQVYIYGQKIKLLDNVKIHNAMLFRGFKYFNFNIPSYCTTFSVV